MRIRCRYLPLLAVSLLFVHPLGAAPKKRPAASVEGDLSTAQELLDTAQAAEAARLLDGVIDREPRNARAFLLRSTARFLLGDREAGRGDLEKGLKLDPTARQGWLTLAALELSDGNNEGALRAFEQARRLDPAAPDNEINIGAVILLMGDLAEATRHFQLYLQQQAGSAEAHYLVATNYAMVGYAALALQHLAAAIDLDERVRLGVKVDPNFSSLASSPELQALLQTDRYSPPVGSLAARREYDFPYAQGKNDLLASLLDVLQRSGAPYDPRVEVNPEWALIWGETRIKVSSLPGDRAAIDLSAPPDRITPAEWRRRSEKLLDDVFFQIQKRRYAESTRRPVEVEVP